MSVAPLQALLIDWRAARIPALSEKIHLIGDRLPVTVPPLRLQRKSDAARAWLQAVKSEPPHLLSARLRQLEQLGRTLSTPLFWPLLEALSRLPPDPRIATFAARVLVQDLRLPWTAKLLRRLLDCVETHGDDTHFRLLEAGLSLNLLGDHLAGRALRLLQRGLREHPKGPSLTLAERKALAATTWGLPEVAPPLASLLAPVWANPRDRALRQVLADQLLERGDERGEFISLQLARAGQKRQRQLLKRHRAEWLGPLADLVDLTHQPPVFEDGFASEVTVKEVKRAQFLLAADAREWATVRRVRWGLQRFSSAMVGLEDAGPVKLEALRQAAREALPLTLRSLAVASPPGPVVDALAAWPHALRWLALVFDVWEPTRELRDQLPRLAELEGLERLRLSARSAEALPAVLREMGLGWLPGSLQELQLRDDDRVVVLRRGAAGGAWDLELLALSPPHDLEWKDFLSALRWLEPGAVRVTVRGDEDASALISRAERFGRPVEEQRVDAVPENLRW